ncbi:restriction endonuclease fold toxin 5 domain-containing protein [Halomonas sp. DP5N14-9]|uniref:Tox-REase-5 domain-containing protein n=1 Tax=Halomonas sp. DP5N14-9 TaxID=2859075 RepID=UPI001C99B160|nr:Tox-REase-5 domain-containing protein [Halomonas sp. DP5N14-9]MBY5942402.1 restriction endonuclease fold toxin 5 domain-containing protein [Halomonas sp. DP5N14-9]
MTAPAAAAAPLVLAGGPPAWLAAGAVAVAAVVYIAIVSDDETDLEDLGDVGDVAEPNAKGEGETEENQDAKPIPGSTTDVGVRTKECEDCNDCKPRDGYIHQPYSRNYQVGGGDWVFYQLFIANMGGGPFFGMANGRLQEWKYNGVDFDGFWSNSCTLVEAKKGYDKFLIKKGKIWQPKDIPFMISTIDSFRIEAQSQIDAIEDSIPPATLRWYFSAHPTYLYFRKLFKGSRLGIECQFLPYSDSMTR